MLARWGRIEDSPPDPSDWEVTVRGAAKLADALQAGHAEAALFKRLATLRVEPSLLAEVDDLRWIGPTALFAEVCASFDTPALARRAEAIAASR